MKLGRLMPNNMPITGIWSKLKSEEEFQYGGRFVFPNQKQLYLRRGLSYPDEI